MKTKTELYKELPEFQEGDIIREKIFETIEIITDKNSYNKFPQYSKNYYLEYKRATAIVKSIKKVFVEKPAIGELNNKIFCMYEVIFEEVE